MLANKNTMKANFSCYYGRCYKRKLDRNIFFAMKCNGGMNNKKNVLFHQNQFFGKTTQSVKHTYTNFPKAFPNSAEKRKQKYF